MKSLISYTLVGGLLLISASRLHTQVVHPREHAGCADATPATGAAPVTSDSASANFLRQAREATVRFTDRREAILSGYRRIGPDFPGMGEHWIHIGILMAGGPDPTRPSFLSYTEVDGRPQLVGLAYAIPLAQGQAPPDWPAVPGAWHEHTGSIEDEVLLTQSGMHPLHATPRARLVMLHVWVWLENPAGPFAKENWALPFIRAGLVAPPQEEVQAARALSLASHRAYYGSLIQRLRALTIAERERVRTLVDVYGSKVERFTAGRGDSALEREEVRHLVELWQELWQETEQSVTRSASCALTGLLGPRAPVRQARPN